MLDADKLLQCLRLVSVVALFSTVIGVLPIAARESWSFFLASQGFQNEKIEALWEANVLNREPIILGNVTGERHAKYVLNLASKSFVPWYLFFPATLWYYLGWGNFPARAVALAILANLVFVTIGWGYFKNQYVFQSNLTTMFVLLYVALRYALPSDSSVAAHFGKIALICVFGQIMLLCTQYFPTSQDSFLLVLFCVIYPLCRDSSRYLSTRAAWYLSSQEDVGGKGIHDLRREYPWVFVAWVQIFWATFFRFQVNSLKNPVMATVVIVWQGILEIFMRLTVSARDEFAQRTLRRILACLLCRKSKARERRGTKVHSLENSVFTKTRSLARVSSLSVATDFQSFHNVLDAKAAFYSYIVLTDMAAEYTGIVAVLFCGALYKDRIIYNPFEFYLSSLEDHSRPVDLSALAATTLAQFMVEILVDVCCTYFESARGKNPHLAWLSMLSTRGSFIFLYGYASYFGVALAQVFASSSDSLAACQGQNICLCAGNGLTESGVRMAYCKILYPPDGILPSS